MMPLPERDPSVWSHAFLFRGGGGGGKEFLYFQLSAGLVHAEPASMPGVGHQLRFEHFPAPGTSRRSGELLG